MADNLLASVVEGLSPLPRLQVFVAFLLKEGVADGCAKSCGTVE
jgi:hypothetical protein